jgi:hypothetical protein
MLVVSFFGFCTIIDGTVAAGATPHAGAAAGMTVGLGA